MSSTSKISSNPTTTQPIDTHKEMNKGDLAARILAATGLALLLTSLVFMGLAQGQIMSPDKILYPFVAGALILAAGMGLDHYLRQKESQRSTAESIALFAKQQV